MDAVVAASGNAQQWHVLDLFLDDLGGGEGDRQDANSERVAQFLVGVAKTQRETIQRGSPRKHRVLVFCSGFYLARQAAAALQRAVAQCNASLKEEEAKQEVDCELSEVCCLVSAASFFEGKSTSATAPFALDQCAR